MTTPKRTYILDLVGGGHRKITIPATWKLTFGNVLPYNKPSLGGQGGPYQTSPGWESRIVLRIYEKSKENLRAVMNDVVSFRDEEIEIREQRPKPVVKSSQTKTQKGMADVAIVSTTEPEWFDPDEQESAA